MSFFLSTSFSSQNAINKMSQENKLSSWQAQFSGRWNKVERKGFYEFLVSNGIPSLVAYLMKDSDFSQIFTFDEKDDYRFQLKALGTPTITMPWMKIGRSADDAEVVEGKDPSGAPFQTKFWFDEKEKVLKSWGKNPKNGVISMQTRKIDENGRMLMTHTSIKRDGTSISHSIVLKKAQ